MNSENCISDTIPRESPQYSSRSSSVQQKLVTNAGPPRSIG